MKIYYVCHIANKDAKRHICTWDNTYDAALAEFIWRVRCDPCGRYQICNGNWKVLEEHDGRTTKKD